MAETYQSFTAFIEECVMPIASRNPTWKQIDGKDGTPTRSAAAYFMHDGAKYKVDGDSGIEQLLAPYMALKEGKVSEPLAHSKTRGGNRCLVPTLGSSRKFYVYLVKG